MGGFKNPKWTIHLRREGEGSETVGGPVRVGPSRSGL